MSEKKKVRECLRSSLARLADDLRAFGTPASAHVPPPHGYAVTIEDVLDDLAALYHNPAPAEIGDAVQAIDRLLGQVETAPEEAC